MLDKRFESQKLESLQKHTVDNFAIAKTAANLPEFKVGTKYAFDSKTWYVVHAKLDSGTEFRQVMSNFGDRQVMELRTLHSDFKNGDIEFQEPTFNETVLMKAAAAELGK